jgi:hypothetical protein
VGKNVPGDGHNQRNFLRTNGGRSRCLNGGNDCWITSRGHVRIGCGR